MDKYLKFPTFCFLLIYSSLFILFSFFSNYILYDDALFYKSFGETLGIDRIDALIKQQKIFQKISYGFIPILLLLRAFYTSICLVTGALFSEQELNFKQCFNIAIKADIIFLFEIMVKINYFSIVEINSLQDINTRLFSILQLVGVQETWMSYPLNILNIFELIYWILLALFFSNYTKKSFLSSMGFVAQTYILGLFLWVLLIMFIILNLT
jgi:hypothetical protein